jgi:hypothetical protein
MWYLRKQISKSKILEYYKIYCEKLFEWNTHGSLQIIQTTSSMEEIFMILIHHYPSHLHTSKEPNLRLRLLQLFSQTKNNHHQFIHLQKEFVSKLLRSLS